MSGRRGVLIALGIGALGWGATYAVGVFLADLPAVAALTFGTGLAAGGVTRGGAPFLGLIAGYGGAWAGYLWYYATFVGFRDLQVLIIPSAAVLVVVAAFAFGIGRVVRPLVSQLARRLGPRVLDG